MDDKDFESLVAQVGFNPVPERFKNRLRNVALTIELDPPAELAREIGLRDDELLLGFYHGIPQTERGEGYGVGFTLPDKITLFKNHILEEAAYTGLTVRRIIEETIWHEVAHHFGLSEEEVEVRERELGWRQ